MLRAGKGILRVEEAKVNKGSLYAGEKVDELKKELEEKFSLIFVAV